jgi:hypothetical protein
VCIDLDIRGEGLARNLIARVMQSLQPLRERWLNRVFQIGFRLRRRYRTGLWAGLIPPRSVKDIR